MVVLEDPHISVLELIIDKTQHGYAQHSLSMFLHSLQVFFFSRQVLINDICLKINFVFFIYQFSQTNKLIVIVTMNVF